MSNPVFKGNPIFRDNGPTQPRKVEDSSNLKILVFGPDNVPLDDSPVLNPNMSDDTQHREAKDSSEYNRKRTADLVTNGGVMKAELLGLDNKIQRAIDKSVNNALDKLY